MDAEHLLSSWQDGPTRRAITDFVARVTDAAGPSFMPAAERVAVFDNDGTLWCEKSMPIQLAYVLQQLAAIAERDHAWLGGAIVKHYQGDDGDLQRLLGGGLATLDGVDVDDATAWLAEDTRPPG